MAARRPSAMTRLSLILPSCTVAPGASPAGGESAPAASGTAGEHVRFRQTRWRDLGQVQRALLLRLGQGHRARARSGLGFTRLPRPGPATPTAVDDQAV